MNVNMKVCTPRNLVHFKSINSFYRIASRMSKGEIKFLEEEER